MDKELAITKQVVSVDPVVFSLVNDELSVLLLNREKEPHKGTWALPGGVINQGLDYSLDEAVERVLNEKTQISVNYKEQLVSIGGSHIDPRSWTVSVAYIALVDYKKTLNPNTKWVKISELKDYYLGFSHHYDIIEKAIERLTNKVNYSTLPVFLLEEKFTLPQLQKVYEILLGADLDKSSFRKQIIESGLLKDTNDMIKEGAYRPAKLYTVEKESIHHFKKNIIKN